MRTSISLCGVFRSRVVLEPVQQLESVCGLSNRRSGATADGSDWLMHNYASPAAQVAKGRLEGFLRGKRLTQGLSLANIEALLDALHTLGVSLDRDYILATPPAAAQGSDGPQKL